MRDLVAGSSTRSPLAAVSVGFRLLNSNDVCQRHLRRSLACPSVNLGNVVRALTMRNVDVEVILKFVVQIRRKQAQVQGSIPAAVRMTTTATRGLEVSIRTDRLI